MVSLTGPPWFLEVDIVLNLVFMLVAGIVSLTGFRAYLFFKDEKHKLHSRGFFLLSASYLLLALSNLFIVLELRHIDFTFRQLLAIANTATVGSLIHSLLFLGGLTYLVIVYLQITDRSVRVLLFILVLFGVLLSRSMQGTFYLLAAVLLLFIIVKLAKRYREKHHRASLFVLAGFIGLFAGEVLLSIIFLDTRVYVAAAAMTLVGYLCILGSQVMR